MMKGISLQFSADGGVRLGGWGLGGGGVVVNIKTLEKVYIQNNLRGPSVSRTGERKTC